MWSLLLQIFILMLLAAALGAALMWWWLNAGYESLAQSRERLLEQAHHVAKLATRDDVATQGATVLAALAGQKPVDLAPIDDTLQGIRRTVADIRMPETDLAPVQLRIDALEARLASFSLDPVLARVSDVDAALSQVGPALEERLVRLEATLENLKGHRYGAGTCGIGSLGLTVNALEPRLSDLGARIEDSRRDDMDAISGRFSTISTAISAVRSPDLAPLQQRLSEIHAAVANIRIPDVAPIQTRLGEVQASIVDIPQPNLQPLHRSLADLEAFVVTLDKPPRIRGRCSTGCQRSMRRLSASSQRCATRRR